MFTDEELEIIEEALFDYQHKSETSAERRLVNTIIDKIERQLNG